MRERAVLERENKALTPAKAKAPAKTPTKPAAPQLPLKCRQSSPWPDADCAGSTPSADRVKRRVVALTNVIAEGVWEKKLHSNTPKGQGLFAGSWDWHSAVHAHWALLSMSRVHNLVSMNTWLTNRLTDDALSKEADFLSKNKKTGFEVPYGRAWLLLVLFELRRRGRASATLTQIMRGIEDDVLGYLDRSTLPENQKTGRFAATHDSWLFAYLLFVLSNPSQAAVTRLRKLRQTKLEPVRAKIAAVVPAKSDFMDLPAVLALVDRVDPAFTGTPARLTVGPSPALDDPPFTKANEHSPGTALVQIWPHAFEAHRGDKPSCSRYHARMNEMFNRTDQWADSFEQVSHWVPQFMWMGMWLAAGRP